MGDIKNWAKPESLIGLINYYKQSHSSGQARIRGKVAVNSNSVLAHIHFKVISPHVEETIHLAHSSRLDENYVDESLTEEYIKALRKDKDPIIKAELARLEAFLRELFQGGW